VDSLVQGGGSLGGNGIDVTQLDLMAFQVINVFQRSNEIILGELNLKWHIVADGCRWVSWLFPDCSAGTNKAPEEVELVLAYDMEQTVVSFSG